ncbi:hypothetical protein B0I35DRAFT_431904 [Stachybotrys elegans]|uniref:Ubiquitin interaction domain-containing protein n=1 Tax=Stachybotrys elegans TaxID=80388 RepID=A0A8K0SR78_9HYPO|nr:hypothetical protein B0I35DRAFT_431904 [Stachybotrys elegans]
MAPMEPSEEQITQVIDFANLNPIDDRSMVIQALKGNDLNAETVIMQYFDNSETFRSKYSMKWDETMFTADRNGTGHTGISFHIESPSQNDVIQGVTPPPTVYGPGAPSRPPSRTNNRSPLSKIVDWALPENGIPNSQAEEDEDMQRALRASAEEAGVPMEDHETGIMDSSIPKPIFGPANRPDYDQDSWAMVPTGTKAVQIERAPAASLRKRADGAPAFLIHGQGPRDGHCLGGLLTILHEIPLARNILLAFGTEAPSYGHNSEWWGGQAIIPPHVLAKMQSNGAGSVSTEEAKPMIHHEVHRLMAFLDATERSYGSVSVLTDALLSPSQSTEKQFFEHIYEEDPEAVSSLTQVVTIIEESDEGYGETEGASFGLLEAEHAVEDYADIKTLYECIDHIMWNDIVEWEEINTTSKMATFKQMGETFAIKIAGGGPSDSMEIPEVLYPERWLESRAEEAKLIQSAWCETKKLMSLIKREGEQLNVLTDKGKNLVVDKSASIRKEIEQWKGFSEYLENLARFGAMRDTGFDPYKYPDYRHAPCEMKTEEQHLHDQVGEVLEWMDKVLLDLDERMKSHRAHLDKLTAKQRFLGKLLTQPDKPGRSIPMSCKKYMLRGVATPGNVTYVCQRAVPQLVELDDEPVKVDQWWRLAYTPNQNPPVLAEKIEVERLMREVWSETKNPLLIYATETALKVPRHELPSALDRFARADNKAFRNELNQEKEQPASEASKVTSFGPLSPSKRKHRADSIDSMDTNRASLGSFDRDEMENPFVDHDTTQSEGTEMVDMATVISDASSARLHSPELSSVDYRSARAEAVRRSYGFAGSQDADMEPLLSRADAPLTADDGESSDGLSSDVEMSKEPEMQERARTPALITIAGSQKRGGAAMEDMDMNIPDGHD